MCQTYAPELESSAGRMPVAPALITVPAPSLAVAVTGLSASLSAGLPAVAGFGGSGTALGALVAAAVVVPEPPPQFTPISFADCSNCARAGAHVASVGYV